jgi:hypothetical protein
MSITGTGALADAALSAVAAAAKADAAELGSPPL